MTSRVAPCPSCGAQVEFSAGSSIVAVCAYCRTAVGRVGGDVGQLEILGKVAPLAAIGSPLKLGMRGARKGRGFALVGRVQYGWVDGARDDAAPQGGLWNEWHAAFDDGDWGWIAEAQGQVYLTFERQRPATPPFAEWRVGTRLTLSTTTVVAIERRTAKVVAAEGELPVRMIPGSKFRYVDVEGPSGVFGTVDFGGGEEVEAIYLGHKCAYEELFDKADLKVVPKEEAPQVLDLKCPSCGAAVELREPDEAQRITCARCDALLDVQQGSALFLVNAAARKGPKPLLELGSKGKYKGQEWTVYGHLVRSVNVEGVTYSWDEHLLRGANHQGWRWLLVQNGHWSWIEPVSAADTTPSGKRAVEFRDRTFRHFQTSSPAVEHIRGEFYWKVAVGERVRASDYVAPPQMLSEEVGADETTWSLGTYMAPGEVEQIFGLKKRLVTPSGVAPNQPNPHAARLRQVAKPALFATVALGALGLLFSARASERILYEDHKMLAEPVEIVLTEPFVLVERSNLEIAVSADVDNSWLYLAGALIHEDEDKVDTFGVEVSYYHGVSGGESWREGGSAGRIYLGDVAPGNYVLRLEPQWDKSGAAVAGLVARPPTAYRVKVRADVFMGSHWFFALFLLWTYPLWLLLRRGAFEGKRWQESDYAS